MSAHVGALTEAPPSAIRPSITRVYNTMFRVRWLTGAGPGFAAGSVIRQMEGLFGMPVQRQLFSQPHIRRRHARQEARTPFGNSNVLYGSHRDGWKRGVHKVFKCRFYILKGPSVLNFPLSLLAPSERAGLP
jgi:hypothetical protein